MALLRRRLLLVLGLAAMAVGAARAQGTAPEYQLKAAFLYNFVKFVEWPDSAFPEPGSPLTLCVVGEDPFGATLDEIVRGEVLDGRRLVVDRSRRPEELDGCHVLFVSRSERHALKEICSDLFGSSALTVGDVDGFLDAGCMVRFTLEANKVRFEINLDAAEKSPLKISSKLLRLARPVRMERRER